jgi:hypothetical protein
VCKQPKHEDHQTPSYGSHFFTLDENQQDGGEVVPPAFDETAPKSFQMLT